MVNAIYLGLIPRVDKASIMLPNISTKYTLFIIGTDTTMSSFINVISTLFGHKMHARGLVGANTTRAAWRKLNESFNYARGKTFDHT